LRKEQFLAPIEEIGKGRQKTTSEGEDLFCSLRGCRRGYQALEAAMRGLGSFSAAGSGQAYQRKGLARGFGGQLMKKSPLNSKCFSKDTSRCLLPHRTRQARRSMITSLILTDLFLWPISIINPDNLLGWPQF
jgi:hypothetical protein